MTAQPRKPRPIGPRAVEELTANAEVPDDAESGDELSQEGFSAFQESLSTDELLDLDDAAGGVMFRDEVQLTTRMLLACAWIWKRREKKRLTWRQVRALPRDEVMTLIGDFIMATMAFPKDDAPEPSS
jgi:hypothetical protein